MKYIILICISTLLNIIGCLYSIKSNRRNKLDKEFSFDGIAEACLTAYAHQVLESPFLPSLFGYKEKRNYGRNMRRYYVRV